MVRICQYCRFARIVEGLSRPIPVCDRKKGRRGRILAIELGQGFCANFESTDDPPVFRVVKGLVTKADFYKIRLIPLTLDQFAIVDAIDYERLARYIWHARRDARTFYAARTVNKKRILMHREVVGFREGMVVDHIDRNGLNNRRSNLRFCSPAQNGYNRRCTKNAKSKYKGVFWIESYKKYRTTITKDGKKYQIGYFKNEIDAARAYDAKARELFGEYACLNF